MYSVNLYMDGDLEGEDTNADVNLDGVFLCKSEGHSLVR